MWGSGSFRESANAHARAWWPAYVVLLTGIAVRLAILFSTALVPQTDGAYYLAQVRSLVSGEGLRFSDTPLLFWLQAVLAQVLAVLANLDQDSAIIWAVKLVDAIVPPLAVLPVFALWLRWTPPERRSILAAITVATLPALSFALFKMTGDLQKNAFALVFFSLLLLAFDTAARSFRARDWLAVGLALAACALSHIGVFAAALTFLLPALVTVATVGKRTFGMNPRRVGLVAAGVALAGGGVYAWSLAIPKISALSKTLLSPLSLFGGVNTFTRLTPGAGPGGVPDLIAVLLAWIPLVLVLVVGRRTARDRATTATLVGAVVSGALLSFPLLSGIDGLRLHLMAYLPVSAAVAWLIGSLPPTGSKIVCAILLLANVLAVGPVIPQATRPTIAEPSYAELRSLRDHMGDSQNTVVVARHGLEWWAAWALGSDVAVVPTVGATPSLWKRYQRVLLLQETKVPDENAGPRRGAPAPGVSYRSGGAPVEGANVIYEGEWYRLSEAPTVFELGPSFEGEQRAGAAPRPEAK